MTRPTALRRVRRTAALKALAVLMGLTGLIGLTALAGVVTPLSPAAAHGGHEGHGGHGGHGDEALTVASSKVMTLGSGRTVASLPNRRAEPALPARFRDKVVIGGLDLPTSIVFTKDGSVAFIAEKSGIVKSFDRQLDGSYDDPTPTDFADLRTGVHNWYDRGLLGITVDPDFPARPYVYVAYTYDFDLRTPDVFPKWGVPDQDSDDCPQGGNGPDGNGCVAAARISRLTAAAGAEGWRMPEEGERVLTDGYCLQFPSHASGAVHMGSDGYLYATVGDGASFDFADYGQIDNPPAGNCGDPDGEGGSLRSQDVRTTGDPTKLNGAIIRIDPDTGAAAPGNPITTGDANARRIAAFGLRNPFRFTFRPGTREVWVADVGSGFAEELNRIAPVGSVAAQNFGWPCYEGAGRNTGFDGLDLPICESLYSAGGVTKPYYTYASRGGNVSPGDSCPTGTAAISGVQFLQAASYPARFRGAVAFSDYSRDCIWVLGKKANGMPDPNTVTPLVQQASNPVDLTTGPDGDLYYVDLGVDDRGFPVPGNGAIHRVKYYAGNQPPTPSISADHAYGPAPLNVTFSAAASSDPDGDALSYEWDTDGDGVFDDGTAATASATYAESQNVIASVRVSDGKGESDRASMTVYPGNTPPTLLTVTPDDSQTWKVGDPIEFAATGTDAEDGGTLTPDKFRWSVAIRHCPSICHTHPVQNLDFTNAGSIVAPDHEYPSTLLLTVSAFDNRGMSTSRSVELQPQPVSLGFATSPAGLAVIAGDQRGKAFDKTFIVGSRFTLSAPARQLRSGKLWTFRSWSDGGARTHDVVAPETTKDYRAAYAPVRQPVRFLTSLKGLKVLVAGASRPSGYRRTFQVGSRVQVSAPKVQVRNGVRYVFVGWSDKKPRTHLVSVPNRALTLKATYRRA